MAIQILPAQLANQIAAGEVVERPASVVKELIENSLDAGAFRIDVDIEQGGSKLIRLRDNGCGIVKNELTLALTRHATSKIATLDDLEAIVSLGFRGEALASISSVSRLTLSSRTTDQHEAWQAYTEGRDMQVRLKPIAHPVGTTIEVLDLFYNTPARRKFLRTEKTEFSHIDEVIRRIALVRFDVTINLTHNGKIVRRYSAVKKDNYECRLASLCGTAFLQQALRIFWQHHDLKISGWIIDLTGNKHVTELQYCYVNGRVVRDKLLNHAIRQAYYDKFSHTVQPVYVLYIDVKPDQVDVNVHPSKHEVRFHQSRMIHDFVYQAVITVLRQVQNEILTPNQNNKDQLSSSQSKHRISAGVNQFIQSGDITLKSSGNHQLVSKSTPVNYGYSDNLKKQHSQESKLYRQLIDSSVHQELCADDHASLKKLPLFPTIRAETELLSTALAAEKTPNIGRVLTISQGSYAVVEYGNQLGLVSLIVAERYLKQAQLLINKEEKLRSQPLLIPLVITINANERQAYEQHQLLLGYLGLQLILIGNRLEIRAVPQPLRQQNLATLLPTILNYLHHHSDMTSDNLAFWIANELQIEHQIWTLSQAIALLADLEHLCPEILRRPNETMIQPIELQTAITALTNE